MTSYYTLEPGAAVRASDGTEIGKVEHVLADAASDIFDGLVIDVRTGPGGHRFVDAPQVAQMDEDGGVTLTLDAECRRGAAQAFEEPRRDERRSRRRGIERAEQEAPPRVGDDLREGLATHGRSRRPTDPRGALRARCHASPATT